MVGEDYLAGGDVDEGTAQEFDDAPIAEAAACAACIEGELGVSQEVREGLVLVMFGDMKEAFACWGFDFEKPMFWHSGFGMVEVRAGSWCWAR